VSKREFAQFPKTYNIAVSSLCVAKVHHAMKPQGEVYANQHSHNILSCWLRRGQETTWSKVTHPPPTTEVLTSAPSFKSLQLAYTISILNLIITMFSLKNRLRRRERHHALGHCVPSVSGRAVSWTQVCNSPVPAQSTSLVPLLTQAVRSTTCAPRPCKTDSLLLIQVWILNSPSYLERETLF